MTWFALWVDWVGPVLGYGAIGLIAFLVITREDEPL